MKVGELKAALDDFEDDAEVLIDMATLHNKRVWEVKEVADDEGAVAIVASLVESVL